MQGWVCNILRIFAGPPSVMPGLTLSAAYLLCAAVLAPELWLEPLGSLVKTVPAMILMLVALAIRDNR